MTPGAFSIKDLCFLFSEYCVSINFPPLCSGHPVSSAGTVSVQFQRTSNSGPARFKLMLEATSPATCPSDTRPDTCPEGPCCQGEDCCVLHAGTVPRGETINMKTLNFLPVFVSVLSVPHQTSEMSPSRSH